MGAKPTCLIVDGSVYMRECAKRVLKRFDCNAAAVFDGLTALDKYEELQPDLILVDSNMSPGRLSGLGFLRLLQVWDDVRLPIIVYCTGNTSDVHSLKVHGVKVHAFLSKDSRAFDAEFAEMLTDLGFQPKRRAAGDHK